MKTGHVSVSTLNLRVSLNYPKVQEAAPGMLFRFFEEN
jgi:hypothetical protein